MTGAELDAPRSALALVRDDDSMPLQRAELVWRQAMAVTDILDHHDLLALILEVLRTADHDVATVSHALTLGRTRVREDPVDLVAQRGTRFLEQALAFMGVVPRAGDR